jgi:chondroitin AC lyase
MESKKVFTLWFNHGKNVKAGTYAYIVVPGKNTADEMEQYKRGNTVEILANTGSIQAVWHKGLDILGIIFYEAGVFEHNGVCVQSDKACAILLKNMRTPTIAMYISDPAQAKSQITIQSQFPTIPGIVKQTVCDFRETGVYAGATKAYMISTGSS